MSDTEEFFLLNKRIDFLSGAVLGLQEQLDRLAAEMKEPRPDGAPSNNSTPPDAATLLRRLGATLDGIAATIEKGRKP